MLNLRYIFRLIAAFFTRFKILILISMGAGIIFFFFLTLILPSINKNSSVRIGATGRYTLTSLPSSILAMAGEGLTKLDENGNILPSLASSWETTDKGKTWTFTLKNDLVWQDGKKVTSQGINYQFSDVTVERPNDSTIVFKLQNAYSAFPSVVSKPTFKSGLLGTGEWEVTKLSLNGTTVEQITLVSKEEDKIVYKFYPSEERTKLAFKLGQVDSIEDIFDANPFTDWERVKIDKSTSTGEYVAVFFNNSQDNSNLLADKNLRQALSYAINKEVFPGVRTVSPISISSWAYNPQVKPYDYDTVKAKEMISDYKESSKIETITINLSTTPLLLPDAERIAKDWKEVGVEVNIQAISVVPTDYQAFLAIYDVPDDPDQYSMWHSTQTSTNITRYQDARIDKLLEDGRSQIDLTERKKTYFDFQRFLVEDAPAAFLYYPETYTIRR